MEKIPVRKLDDIETAQIWQWILLWILVFAPLISGVVGGILALLALIQGIFE